MLQVQVLYGKEHEELCLLIGWSESELPNTRLTVKLVPMWQVQHAVGCELVGELRCSVWWSGTIHMPDGPIARCLIRLSLLDRVDGSGSSQYDAGTVPAPVVAPLGAKISKTVSNPQKETLRIVLGRAPNLLHSMAYDGRRIEDGFPSERLAAN
ncbi:hypothetical protein N7527_006441 [Penicillium freii]|nr:hypothetical protein N7527_006441 [Penicillium freii]